MDLADIEGYFGEAEAFLQGISAFSRRDRYKYLGGSVEGLGGRGSHNKEARFKKQESDRLCSH